MWRYLFGPNVTLTSLAIPLYGRWSTSGSDRGNAHFFTGTSNTIEGNRRKENEQKNNMLRINSNAEGELCNTASVD